MAVIWNFYFNKAQRYDKAMSLTRDILKWIRKEEMNQEVAATEEPLQAGWQLRLIKKWTKIHNSVDILDLS